MERAEGLEAVFRCQYQAEGVIVTYDWAINHSLVLTDTDYSSTSTFVSWWTNYTDNLDHSTAQQLWCSLRGYNQKWHYYCKVWSVDHSNSNCSWWVSNYLCIRLYRHFPVGTVITNVLSAPNTITVTWNALPFTNYCVDVNRTTLDSTETVVIDSVCGLTNEYIFMYSDNSVCARFTVTPTDGEMRGTTSELYTGLFTRVEGVFIP